MVDDSRPDDVVVEWRPTAHRLVGPPLAAVDDDRNLPVHAKVGRQTGLSEGPRNTEGRGAETDDQRCGQQPERVAPRWCR